MKRTAKKILVIMTLTLLAASLCRCGKKEEGESAASRAAEAETEETVQDYQTVRKAELDAQKEDAAVNYDYADVLGDEGTFLAKIWGLPDEQNTEDRLITAEYTGDRKATFLIAIEDYETDENGPDVADTVQVVYKAVSTAGELLNMKKDTISNEDMLSLVSGEEIEASDGFAFNAEGYIFVIKESEEGKVKKTDEAYIILEDYFEQ